MQEAREVEDLATNYLGYWTDNGAYYYYNPMAGSTYEETLVKVAAELAQVEGNTVEAKLPYATVVESVEWLLEWPSY